MTERTISEDLAALGALDGRDLIELDRLDAFAAPRTMPVTPPAFAAAHALAGRAGWLAAGAAMLAYAIAIVAGTWLDTVDVWKVKDVIGHDWPWWTQTPFPVLVAAPIVCALAAHNVGSAIARRLFARARPTAPDALALGSTALAIAGTSSVAILLGRLVLTVGCGHPLAGWVREQGSSLTEVARQCVVDTTFAVAAAAVLAVPLALSIVRGWMRWPGAVIVGGVVLGLTTLTVGSKLDVGRIGLYNGFFNDVPSHPLRIALTAAGSLAVVLTATGLAAARHRRDQRIIDARTI